MFRRGMRRFIVGLLTLVALSWALPAAARGSVKLVSNSVDEDDGTWKLKFTIDYGKKPHIGHIPMTFSFKQTAIYERSLTDEGGDKPVERTVPVSNAEPNNLPVDVGFSNPKGEMFQITKFTIKLRRDADFEAGEYDLTVKESSGQKIGGTLKVKLRGKNKIINRKAISFDAPPPKPKPDKPAPGMEEPEDEGPVASEDRGPDLSDIPDIAEDDEPDNAGKVPPKQGGCGCEVAGADTSTRFGGLALLLALAALRRRDGLGVS